MSLTDYDEFCSIYKTKKSHRLLVISNLVHVMLLGAHLESQTEKYLFISPWTLGLTQWLITGRGMCVYILLTRNESTADADIVTQNMCWLRFECWRSNYKAISLNLTEKRSFMFKGRYKYILCRHFIGNYFVCCIFLGH